MGRALDPLVGGGRYAVQSAQQHHLRLVERSRRLGSLAAELEAALAAWEPARADLDLVADLASLVEGKHPDNRLQMRLSAYVLAHRLSQVVDVQIPAAPRGPNVAAVLSRCRKPL